MFDPSNVVGLDVSEDQHSVTHTTGDHTEREPDLHKACAVVACSYGTLEWMFTIDKATMGDECIKLGVYHF